jgi:hypothetical protein
MTSNDNAARKLRPDPLPDYFPPPEPFSPLAAFVVVALAAGPLIGYLAGVFTGFILWHH